MANEADANYTPNIPDSEIDSSVSNSNENNSLGSYSGQGTFRFWCQKVLPLVYDDSLSYYELLCKVVNYLNNVISDVGTMESNIAEISGDFDSLQNYVNTTKNMITADFDGLQAYVNTTKDTLIDTYNELQGYVNDYFNNLDVQEEINNKLDAMAVDGSLTNLLQPYLTTIFADLDVLEARVDQLTSLPDGSTAGDAELEDIRVGYNAIVYNTAGDAVREQVEDLHDSLDAMLTEDILLNPIYFVLGRGLNSSNQEYDATKRAISYFDFNLDEPVKIVCPDTVGFCLYSTDLGDYVLRGYPALYRGNNLNARILVKRLDETTMTVTDVSSIHIYTTKAGKQQFLDKYTYTIKQTEKLKSTDYVNAYNIRVWGRFKLGETADTNLGCLTRPSGFTAYRCNFMPFICDKAVTLVAGRLGTVTIKALYNGAFTDEIVNGQMLTIPANTYFSLSCGCTPTDYSSSYETASAFIVPDTIPESVFAQTISPDNMDMSHQASCLVGNVIYMISGTSEEANSGFYGAKSGSTVYFDRESLGHVTGHANSCNYDNGYIYVSDWTDASLIHVFAVDDTTHALTYTKDIVIPVNVTDGSREYYVFDNEKQIFFLGWKTGNSATAENALVYGLYVFTGTTYSLAWIKEAVRCTTLQSFTYQNGYMYYIEVDETANRYTKNIHRINLATGETEHNSGTYAGSITTHEAEGITPIGNQIFFVTEALGTGYMATFV